MDLGFGKQTLSGTIEEALGITSRSCRRFHDEALRKDRTVSNWSAVCCRVAVAYGATAHGAPIRFRLLSSRLPAEIQQADIPLVAEMAHIDAETAFQALMDLVHCGLLTKTLSTDTGQNA